jgi:hypothetical protein
MTKRKQSMGFLLQCGFDKISKGHYIHKQMNYVAKSVKDGYQLIKYDCYMEIVDDITFSTLTSLIRVL